MKKLIALAVLVVALPAVSGERSYQVENMLAGFYACYWHYEESGEAEKSQWFLSEHSKMASAYSIHLADRNKTERASKNMAKLAHDYPDKYNINAVCSLAHDKFSKPEL